MRFYVAGVSLGLSLELPDSGYRVLTIKDATNLLQRQRPVRTFGLDDGEVKPNSLEYEPCSVNSVRVLSSRKQYWKEELTCKQCNTSILELVEQWG
jgi:hypothetical protein